MRYILYALLVYALVSLNTALFPILGVFGAVPQFILIACTILAVTEDNIGVVCFVAFLGGFFWELITGIIPGSLMLGYMLGIWFVYMLSRRVFFLQDRVKYLPLFLAAIQAIASISVLTLNVYARKWGLSNPAYDFFSFWRLVVGSFVYNLVLLYPLYFLLSQFEQLLAIVERQRHTLK